MEKVYNPGVTETLDISGIRFQFRFKIGTAMLNVFCGSPLFRIVQTDTNLPHNHGYYELRFVLDNPMYMYIGEQEYTIEPESAVIVHPYEYHTVIRSKDTKRISNSFAIAFQIESISEVVEEGELDMAAAIAHLRKIRIIPNIADKLMPMLLAINAEMRKPKKGYVFVITHLLEVVMHRFFRELLEGDTVEKAEPVTMRDVLIEQFFYRNYQNAVKMDELSNILGVSNRRTGQIIQEFYHCSFSEKLAQTRLEIAKFYLCYSDNSIEKIATACGFPSLNFFFKLFRRYVGVSPKQYRENSRAQRRMVGEIHIESL